MEAIEAWAREQGARLITAGTYLDSPVATPFWEERMGYRRRSVILAKRLDYSPLFHPPEDHRSFLGAAAAITEVACPD